MTYLDKFNADCDLIGERMDAMQAEIDQLRGFALRLMESWPCGDLDGGELQDAAVAFGLLELRTPAPTEPCGENCGCAEYASAEEFSAGEVRCFTRAALLDGGKQWKRH